LFQKTVADACINVKFTQDLFISSPSANVIVISIDNAVCYIPLYNGDGGGASVALICHAAATHVSEATFDNQSPQAAKSIVMSAVAITP